MSDHRTEYIWLQPGDGPRMQAFVARPSGQGPFGSVLLFQEAFGVNHHIRDVAGRVAALGWLCLAPELFHRTAPPGFEGSYTDFASLQPHFGALSVEGLSADIQACYEWLTSQADVDPERLASLGFCLGGRVSFLANTLLPLRAAVSYYGGGTHTLVDRAASLHGPTLFFWGGKDTHISAEHRTAVVQALDKEHKPYVQVLFSEAPHAFHCDERASYHPPSAREAWALTAAFLSDHLQRKNP